MFSKMHYPYQLLEIQEKSPAGWTHHHEHKLSGSQAVRLSG